MKELIIVLIKILTICFGLFVAVGPCVLLYMEIKDNNLKFYHIIITLMGILLGVIIALSAFC